MSLELLIGAAVCLLGTFLIPLSLWQTLGHGGASLLSFVAAGLVTGVILLRHRHAASRKPDYMATATAHSMS
jgi:hypothetical protein